MHDASCQGQRSFQYTGHAERFKVPKCATTIYIDAKGASGKYGGDGGEVGATIPVTPGETLIVTVGGAGQNFKGGFNGGAAGALEIIRHGRNKGKYCGAGGGGATDVRQGGGRWRTASWWRAAAGARTSLRQRRRSWRRRNWRRSARWRQWRNPLLQHPPLPFPSAVAAARSPQEAREEQEATAARWATGASASAAAVSLFMGRGLVMRAVAVAGATTVAVAAVTAAPGAAARVTRSRPRATCPRKTA